MKDWIVKKVIAVYLKGALDKLPFNGWKTVMGVLLIVAGELAKLYPVGPVAYVAEFIAQMIQYVGFDPVVGTGVATLIAGITHKIAKLIEKLVNKEEVKPNDGGWGGAGGTA